MTTTPSHDKFWNAAAESYAAKPVADPEAFERKIEIIRARLRPHHTVLEIGCGTGSLALRLAPSAAEVHGLDISREMVRIARHKAKAEGATNVQFHEGAFETFEVFGTEGVDGLCAFSVLHLMKDRPGALRRMFAVLRPGGFVVASTVCLAESWVPYGPLIRVMQWLGKAPWVDASLSKQRLHADLQTAGFVDLETPDVGAKAIVDFFVARKPG
jgi:ubiquinone/menaquinone biosynthesis C-methylase UbiE